MKVDCAFTVVYLGDHGEVEVGTAPGSPFDGFAIVIVASFLQNEYPCDQGKRRIFGECVISLPDSYTGAFMQGTLTCTILRVPLLLLPVHESGINMKTMKLRASKT